MTDPDKNISLAWLFKNMNFKDKIIILLVLLMLIMFIGYMKDMDSCRRALETAYRSINTTICLKLPG